MLAKIRLQTTDDRAWNPFLNADPLTKLLLYRCRLKTVPAAILVLLIPTLPVYVAATANNVWLSKPGMIGLLQDYGWWWYQLASWPVTIVFFFWMPRGILKVINGLKENEVLVVPRSQDGHPSALSEFISQFSDDYSHRACIYVGFILLMLFMSLYYVPAQRTYLTWTTYSGETVFWYVQFVHTYMLFFMFVIAARSIVAVLWFNRLFQRFDVDVRNLDPDGAGGFGPFGDLIARAGYFIGIYGCTLVVLILEAPYRRSGGESFSLQVTREVFPMMLLYLPLAPSLFFLILRSGHIAMKRARDHHLLKIANKFNREYCTVDSTLDESDYDALSKRVERLELLQQLHEATSRFPIWPIDTRNVTRFFTSWIIPVLIGVAIAVIEWWLGLK